MTIPRILIIAGSDSGGGAGIQADIKTVTMLGGHAMTAITAITAQNTLGVDAVHPVPTDMVIAQIDSVVRDIGVDAVKIGMIGSAETAHAVADRLATFGVPIVFDPVMVATSGSVLADGATIAAFERLMTLASVVTPNTPELGALAEMIVETELDQAAAAERIMVRTGCPAVLAKGGHLVLDGEIYGVDRKGRHYRYKSSERVFDFLYRIDGDGWHEMRWDDARIKTTNTHGTGCTLASAIGTGLAEGRPLADVVDEARRFVRAAMLAAPGLGGGHGPMGHALGVSPFDELEGPTDP